jgi:hypothetical protein
MMRFLLCCLVWFSLSSLTHAGCVRAPSMDFSPDVKAEISSKSYSYLGTLKHQCWYLRDVVFKNGHGQQAVVVASSSGKCLGFFRTSLADGAELAGTKLNIYTRKGEAFKVDVSDGIPKSFYFDGEESSFERCIN